MEYCSFCTPFYRQDIHEQSALTGKTLSQSHLFRILFYVVWYFSQVYIFPQEETGS